MNTYSKLVLVAVFSFFSIQTAWAASTAEVVDAAVQKSTEAEQAKINEAHQSFATTGGKIVVGRDGSVRVYPNGPTTYQRVALTAAYVKDGVVYATVTAYNGAKSADGYVAGVITYPIAKLGEWISTPKAEVKEVAQATKSE